MARQLEKLIDEVEALIELCEDLDTVNAEEHIDMVHYQCDKVEDLL
jgi:hypothetical protein